MSTSCPAGYDGYHIVGCDDLMKELGVTLEEAEFIQDHVGLNFWFIEDENGNFTKFIAEDGCDDYVDFNFRNYILANILDYCRATELTKKFGDIRNKLLSIPNVEKYLYIGGNFHAIRTVENKCWLF
jgi:hypothetical protein